MCVFISLCNCDRVWITTSSEYCMHLIVWMLNINCNQKGYKQFCQLFCIMYTFQIKLMIFLGLPLENHVLLFAWIKAKEYSDISGQHSQLVDWDVTEGIITTGSNRMKLRLIYWMVALIWYNSIRQVFEQLWCTELVTSTPQHYGHEQLFVVY